MKPEPLRICLLGEPRLYAPDGEAIHLPTAKTVAALAMIIAAGEKGLSRGGIGERLWSRSGDHQARANLRQALSAIRKAFGPLAGNIGNLGDLLWLRREGIEIDLDIALKQPAELDAEGIDALLDAGSFLHGIAINDPEFEDWLSEKRTEFDRALQERLQDVGRNLLDDEDFATAERVSRKLIALDNFNEVAHRLRMMALAGLGELATALKHYEELKRLLDKELGVQPGAATTDLAKRLKEPKPIAPDGIEVSKAAQSTSDASAARIPSDGSTEQAQLRNVVVVALDVSPEVNSKSDPGSEIEEIGRISKQVAQVLADFGGTELTNNGTSILAVFGHPFAHSKDGERALRYAQKVLSVAQRGMPTASVRAAMASGIILASSKAGAGVLGDPIRRAQSHIFKTPVGQISADRGVYRATGGLADYRVLGEGLWSITPSIDWPQSQSRFGFFGRERELGQALALLSEVRSESRGEVIVIRGDAGIGKTRLCEEIGAGAEKIGYTIVTCRVLDFGLGRSNDAIALVASALSPNDPPAFNKIERAVWADLVAPDELTPDARQLVRELDQRTLQNEQARVLTRLAKARLAEGPLLLVVEDVHWASSRMMHAIADLAAGMDGSAMALVLTTRPENDPIDNSWRIRAGATPTTTLDLQALRRKDSERLAQNLRKLDDALLNLCLDRAVGNPLFIEQLVYWAEDQTETNLPLSVQNVVQERLDKLPYAARRLAQAASVLGQVFDYGALDAVNGGEISGTEILDGAHLIIRRGDTFTFVHAIVRDSIYASIAPDDRRMLHIRAADHFAGSDPVLSARHHFRSGALGAFRRCTEAAKLEHEKGQLEAAREMIDMALECCDEAAEQPGLLVLRGEILRDSELFADAIEAFEAAVSEDEELSLRAIVGAADCLVRLDDLDRAERLLDQADMIASAKTKASWRTTLACLRSLIEFSRGNSSSSFEFARKAMDASDGVDDRRLRARALSTVADAEMVAGLFKSSERHFTECVDICRETGHKRYELSNLTMVGMLRFYDAEPAEAFDIMLRVIDEARAINFVRAQMLAEHMLCYIEASRENYDAALLHWEQARRLIEATSAKRFIMNSGCYAAMAMGPLGRTSEAMEYVEEAERTARELGVVWVLPWVLASKARWIEEASEARAALDSAEELVLAGKAAYPFEFYYVGIDAALRLSDWTRVETYVRHLETFFAHEPAGLAKLISKKARLVMARARGHGDAAQIEAFIAETETKGLLEARRWLD